MQAPATGMVDVTMTSPSEIVPDPDPSPQPALAEDDVSVLSNRAITWTTVLVIIIGIGLAILLLIKFGNGQHPGQLDAIKTAGTIVVGAGGAVALWLTARRQRTTELGLRQKQRDQLAVDRAFRFQQEQAEQARQHQERVAAAAEADAEARRITELYTRGADQLGSPQSPVRLAGLYALERLAQGNPGQRQTIVHVLCAFLRMPFTVPTEMTRLRAATTPDTDPGAMPSPTGRDALAEDDADAREQLEVRLTAQRILTDHLAPGPDSDDPLPGFWEGMELNLARAVLVNFDLSSCQVATATFDDAHFIGPTSFRGVVATGPVMFRRTRFSGAGVNFGHARFVIAQFDYTRFDCDARFTGAQFAVAAGFREAQATGRIRFEGVDFHDLDFRRFVSMHLVEFAATRFGSARFGGASFKRVAFPRAVFAGRTDFHRTIFELDLDCADAVFEGLTSFTEAHFGDADFVGARFDHRVDFDDAQFAGRVRMTATSTHPLGVGSWVRLDVPDEVRNSRIWQATVQVWPTSTWPTDGEHRQWGRVMAVSAPGDPPITEGTENVADN
ncbi:MAG TPA: pentapeptide repeat-containing protein [Pseudonocardiaceae bacterium]|nr:pentapeptide repeat-containing protein [Pseudonocardiaceae bacterium]